MSEFDYTKTLPPPITELQLYGHIISAYRRSGESGEVRWGRREREGKEGEVQGNQG